MRAVFPAFLKDGKGVCRKGSRSKQSDRPCSGLLSSVFCRAGKNKCCLRYTTTSFLSPILAILTVDQLADGRMVH